MALIKKQHKSKWKTIEIISSQGVYQLSPRGELIRENRPPRHKRRNFYTYDRDKVFRLLCNPNFSSIQKLQLSKLLSLLISPSEKKSLKDTIPTSNSHLNSEFNVSSRIDSLPTATTNCSLNDDENSQETSGANFEPDFFLNSPSFHRNSPSLQNSIFNIGIDSDPLNKSNKFTNIDDDFDPLSYVIDL